MRSISNIITLTIFFLISTLTMEGQERITQSIRGEVVDKESHLPLAGANILVEKTLPVIGTSTSDDGSFRIDRVPLGRQTLIVSFLGYEVVTIPNILVISGKELVLHIELRESAIEMEELVVRADDDMGRAINDMAIVSARSFSVEETSRYAASFSDPARMAQNYAGVSVTGGTSDLFNEIIVRGNSPRGILWRLEGIEIPNPNHFGALGNTGGGISMLSSNILSNSDFYTGAFPAEFGNASSGVFDLNMRKGNDEKREYALMLGILGIEAAGEGPIGKPGGASYLLNLRYSTLSLLQKMGLNPGGDALPEYGDASFNIFLPAKSMGQFNLFGLGGKNITYFHPEKDSTKWEDIYENDGFSERQTTGTVGLAHKILLSDHSYLRTVIAASFEKYDDEEYYLDRFDGYRKYIDFVDVFNNTLYRLTSSYTQKVDAQNSFKLGGIFSHHQFDFFSSEFDQKLNEKVIYLENDGAAEQYQLFGQWKYRASSQLILTGGLHFSHYGLSNRSSLEPRLAAKWEFSAAQSLNFALGLHSKPEHPAFHLSETAISNQERITPNKGLDYTKSMHAVAGYDFRFNKHMRIRTEAYFQYLYDVPVDREVGSKESILNVLDIWDVLDAGPAFNEGNGMNYGLDITIEKYFSRQHYFLITASVFDSRFRMGKEGRWFNTRFNSHYQVNLLAGKEFEAGKTGDNIFGVNCKGILNGGNRLTPIDLESSIAEGFTVTEENRFLSESVGTYYRFDIGLNYKINRTGITHTISLDIQNVTNHLNVLNVYYNNRKQNLENEYHTGILPIINYRVEF